MFLLIDKPKGITSHDVIYRVRKITGEKRVGHAGTLDPNATGLLIVGVGREFTKQLGELTTGTTKTYEAEIFLGATSTTEDSEGVITQISDICPTEEEILKTLTKLEGEQSQIPSKFSAIKLQGKKAYELARKGIEVELEPRKVTIHSIKLREYNYPSLKIECEVSAGTYIRALARDIGEKLGTGAYLSNLRRTKIGTFDIKDAVTLEDFARTTR
jgi:tRNA pseudouridine55 synthase